MQHVSPERELGIIKHINTVSKEKLANQYTAFNFSGSK